MNLDSWDQSDLEFADEKVLEKRLHQLKLQLRLAQDETTDSGRSSKHIKNVIKYFIFLYVLIYFNCNCVRFVCRRRNLLPMTPHLAIRMIRRIPIAHFQVPLVPPQTDTIIENHPPDRKMIVKSELYPYCYE